MAQALRWIVIATAAGAVPWAVGQEAMDQPPTAEAQVLVEGEAASGAPAAPGGQSELEQWIAALGTRSFSDRENATLALRSLPGLTHVALEPWLQRAELTAEQRARLERVAFELFCLADRPGLGVGFVSQEPVEIGTIVEGFDAFGKLRPGDIVVGVDGRPTPNQSWFRSEILSRLPGETMHLLVTRGGEVLELDVQLGSYAALANPQTLTPETLAWAWAWRVARLSLGIAAPPLDPLATAATNGQDAPSSPPVPRTAMTRGPSLVVGGQPRDPNAAPGMPRSVQSRVPQRIDGRVGVVVDAPRPVLPEELNIMAIVRTIEGDIAMGEERLRIAERAGNRDDAERIRTDLVLLRQRLEEMRARLTPAPGRP